jgi:ATP-dependent protease HslVU (ClpYQ) peptidase subunit
MMTTIAATRTQIAGDSMVILEAKSMQYPTIKVRKIKGKLFGAAGDGGDCTRFLDWAETGFNEKKRPKFSTQAGTEHEAILLVVDEEGIKFMSTTDPYPEIVAMDFYAIGSGGKAAWGALYAGATLDQAMEIASAVDPYTRAPFTILTLD